MEVPGFPPGVGIVHFVGSAEVVRDVLNSPGCPGLNGYDGIDRPSLQDLPGRFQSGESVGQLEREPVPDVVVAVAVIQIVSRVIERDSALKILGSVVEAVAVGVRSGE